MWGFGHLTFVIFYDSQTPFNVLQIEFKADKPGFFDYNTVAIDDIILSPGKSLYNCTLTQFSLSPEFRQMVNKNLNKCNTYLPCDISYFCD